MDANKKWLSIPKETRSQIKNNVYCTNCNDAVAIENFTVEDDKLGIVMKGKCQQCGHEVIRLIETF
ncbi:hypothetical protein [Fictibacillus phosphorivorans]|uniref:hypothetical protein n=1 Tax=Fictibacillus phosphorivorans TaxID=1221500 RepID=UPI00203E4CEB|nr:hypothetical protein [Fictibacillus phosphorivorans]MCM3719506.1 hypothetical protein [Fictibacillus phosphorivorans]MCM3777197.1 hypothetical protein [Fictibacillus phosphorivorans]